MTNLPWILLMPPFAVVQAELVGEVHRRGSVQHEAFSNEGTLLIARVPEALASRLRPFSVHVDEAMQEEDDAIPLSFF